MQTPKLLWLKNNLPETWSKAKDFFDLSDFLTWKATGGSKVRSLCSTVCKWTFEGENKTWNESYFKQIGLADLAEENFERIGTYILRQFSILNVLSLIYSTTGLKVLTMLVNKLIFSNLHFRIHPHSLA